VVEQRERGGDDDDDDDDDADASLTSTLQLHTMQKKKREASPSPSPTRHSSSTFRPVSSPSTERVIAAEHTLQLQQKAVDNLQSKKFSYVTPVSYQ
jgi:hypothetical protein